MEPLYPLLLPFFSLVLIIFFCSKNSNREPSKSKELVLKRDVPNKSTQSTSMTLETYLQPAAVEDVKHIDESIKIDKLFDGECTVAASLQRNKNKTRETKSVTGEDDDKVREDHSRKEKRRKKEDRSEKQRRHTKKKNRNDDRTEQSVEDGSTFSQKSYRSVRETDHERSYVST